MANTMDPLEEQLRSEALAQFKQSESRAKRLLWVGRTFLIVGALGILFSDAPGWVKWGLAVVYGGLELIAADHFLTRITLGLLGDLADARHQSDRGR